MKTKIFFQNPARCKTFSKNLLVNWLKTALIEFKTINNISCLITLRIVSINEMIILNEKYRQKKGPTNVLSFSYHDSDTENKIKKHFAEHNDVNIANNKKKHKLKSDLNESLIKNISANEEDHFISDKGNNKKSDTINIRGDIIICAEIVNNEAANYKKILSEYWALMVVHGALHVFGYDHDNDKDALIMEKMENKILHNIFKDNL